jgi:hypothetical protein
MKRFVMVVVGLILTLTSLAGSEDINFQPFKSDKQIAVDQIEEQLGQISGGPNGFGSDNESGAMFNTSNYNFLNEKVNKNLEDIINSIPNRFDVNITSDKDFQMEISKSFDQVIPK